MSAEVENMMYVGEVPWHGLGIKLDAPPTAEEAIIAAGLNWEVNLKDLYTTTEKDLFSPLDSHRAVVRDSDNSILGVVGNRWQPLQNKDAFKFFDPFIESGEAEYHTAGSLKEGKRIWILSKLKGDPITIVKNDVIEKYLLLSNAHDGKVSVNVRFTPIRVVCSNTLNAAESDNQAPFLRIMHRGKVEDTLKEVQNIVSMTNATFETTAEQYRYLASKQVKNLDRYILNVLKPKLQILELSEEEVEKNLPRAKDDIEQLFVSGRGQDNPAVKGTYWAAYNAVTEWVDYKRGRDETRLEKAWYGKGQRIKTLALSTATALAEVA